jgi:hypothetical protein
MSDTSTRQAFLYNRDNPSLRRKTWQGRAIQFVRTGCDVRLSSPYPVELYPELCDFCRSIDFGALWTFQMQDRGDEVVSYFPDDWPQEVGHCRLCALWLYLIATEQEPLHGLRWMLTFDPSDTVTEDIPIYPLRFVVRRTARPQRSEKSAFAFLFPEEPHATSGTFIDFAWVKGSIANTAESTHGRRDDDPIGMKLLDCDTLEVVDAAPSSAYIALSYVIGKQPFDMKASFGKDRLRLDDFPATIRDAIQFVKNIEERYLWVDAICIAASRQDDRQRQLSAMAQIYANARATIASLGESKDSPIFGVSQERSMSFAVNTNGGPFQLDPSVIERRMRQSACEHLHPGPCQQHLLTIDQISHVVGAFRKHSFQDA